MVIEDLALTGADRVDICGEATATNEVVYVAGKLCGSECFGRVDALKSDGELLG